MPEPRVALVTGAGRGIGLAVVQRLLADGSRCGALEISERAIAGAREALAAHAGDVEYIAGSVVDPEQAESCVSHLIARWGRLDVLVNNAAVNRPGGLFEQRQEDWDAVIAVNLTGPFVMSRAAAARMRDQGEGAIVHIGSIGAAGMGASPAYASSKAGLIGLTRQMASELGPSGIRVNYVAPGVTLTDWVERNLLPENIEASAANSPLRRVGTPEDIAGVVAFLCSADARHVTGQVISASGGAWMP